MAPRRGQDLLDPSVRVGAREITDDPTEHYLLAKESGRWGYCEFPGAFGLDDAQGSVSHLDALFSSRHTRALQSSSVF